MSQKQIARQLGIRRNSVYRARLHARPARPTKETIFKLLSSAWSQRQVVESLATTLSVVRYIAEQDDFRRHKGKKAQEKMTGASIR